MGKGFFISIFIISILVTVACNNPDEFYSGLSNAIKNGEPWSSEIYAERHPSSIPGILIKMDQFLMENYRTEGIGFQRIPFEVGYYELLIDTFTLSETLPYSLFSTVLDGHSAGDNYRLLLNDEIDDYIEITEVDGDEIKGLFQASFINDTTNFSSMGILDTVIFTEGEFETKVID